MKHLNQSRNRNNMSQSDDASHRSATRQNETKNLAASAATSDPSTTIAFDAGNTNIILTLRYLNIFNFDNCVQ